MKATTVLTGMALLCLVFMGCMKATDPAPEHPFDRIRKIEKGEDRRAAFSVLNPEEKAAFWQYHITNALPDLTTVQQDLVSEVAQKITARIFIEGTAENVVMVNMTIPQWLTKALAHFSKEQLFDLFFFLEGGTRVTLPITQFPEEPSYVKPPPCACNIGSRWTCQKNTIRASAGTDTSVSWETTYGNCSGNMDNPCSSHRGCGFAGIWSCNGNVCQY